MRYVLKIYAHSSNTTATIYLYLLRTDETLFQKVYTLVVRLARHVPTQIYIVTYYHGNE